MAAGGAGTLAGRTARGATQRVVVARPPIVVRNAVAGDGIAASTLLRGLSRSTAPVAIFTSRDAPWLHHMPRDHELGQTRRSLLLDNFEREDYYLNQRMRAEEAARAVAEHQAESVRTLSLESEVVESPLAMLERIVHGEQRWRLTSQDGTVVLAERVFFAGGLGPERTLFDSGVVAENAISALRRSHREVDTAISFLARDPSTWRNLSITVNGGGATGAWAVERVLSQPVASVVWISHDDFRGANPAGRNSEVLARSESFRYTARMTRLLYNGDGDTPPGHDGLRITLGERPRGLPETFSTDLVINATGSNPWAPTGVRAVLGEHYNALRPYTGEQRGVFAALPDQSLFVVSSALSVDRDYARIIQEVTFPHIHPENRVAGGFVVSNLSAEAIVEAAMQGNKV